MTYTAFVHAQAFIHYQENGGKLRDAARKAGVSPSTLHRWIATSWWGKHDGRCNGRRKVNRSSHVRRPSKLKPEVINEVRRYYIEENGSALQKEIRYHLKTSKNVIISLSSVGRAIKLAGFSRKRLSIHILGTPNNERIIAFNNAYATLSTPPNHIVGDHPVLLKESPVVVSTDEMYASERIIPTHIYSEIGKKRCLTKKDKNNKGGWKQRSLIKSIASDGSQYHEIVQGTVKRVRFSQYIDNLPYPKGSVILLDNSSTRKKIEDTFQRKGYIPLFLPPYCPKFQPVEFAFSKIKGNFRSQWSRLPAERRKAPTMG